MTKKWKKDKVKYWNRTNKRRAFSRKFKRLVRFVSDCWWFAKAWKPVEVKFTTALKTRLTWSMARKRHDIKRAIAKQKSNV